MNNQQRLEARRRRRRVAELLAANPHLNAHQIHDILKAEFGEKNVQTLNAVQKQIAPMRQKQDDELDSHWHLAALAKHELNRNVVPILIAEQAKRAKGNYMPITVRQAIWASRLFSTIAGLLADNPKAIPESVLWWSSEYAVKEKLAEYQDETLDTTDFDAEVLQRPDIRQAYEQRLERHRRVAEVNRRVLRGLRPTFSKEQIDPTRSKRLMEELATARAGGDYLDSPLWPVSHFGWTGMLGPAVDLKKRDKILRERRKRLGGASTQNGQVSK